MSFSCGQVDQPAFPQDHHSIPGTFELVLLDKRSDSYSLRGQLAKSHKVELEIKVATVTNQRAVLHFCEMLAVDNVAVASHRNENISQRRRCSDWHKSETIHHRPDRFDRVDLKDNYLCAPTANPPGHTLSPPNVTDN